MHQLINILKKEVVNKFIYYVVDVTLITIIVILICKHFIIKLTG